MLNRILLGGLVVAAAGATMLAIASTPASAFTASSPSLAAPIAGAHVDKVWWDRWGHWHPNHPYWGPGWGPGWHPRHCWRGYYGHVHCNW